MVEKPCLFDNSKECPVRKADSMPPPPSLTIEDTLERACPICPIHERIMIEARKKEETTKKPITKALTELS